MSANREKVIGYSLLAFGLFLILLSLVFVFLALTGRLKPPTVIDVEAPTLELSNLSGSLELPPQLKEQGFAVAQNQQQPTGRKLIPDEVFTFYINAGIFYLLMMFVASSGSKLASVGVSLIKEVKVKVREEQS